MVNVAEFGFEGRFQDWADDARHCEYSRPTRAVQGTRRRSQSYGSARRYALLGTRLNEHNEILDPIRVDWEAGGAFVAPPGLWRAHINESGAPAHLVPIQDAELQTYLRSLDIKFTNRRDLVAG